MFLKNKRIFLTQSNPSVKNLVKKIIIFIITLYQKYISPLKPSTCRFYPTCSEYAIQALSKYGLLRGAWLSVKRIFRCHPFDPGGFDPLPDSLKRNCIKK